MRCAPLHIDGHAISISSCIDIPAIVHRIRYKGRTGRKPPGRRRAIVNSNATTRPRDTHRPRGNALRPPQHSALTEPALRGGVDALHRDTSYVSSGAPIFMHCRLKNFEQATLSN